jgi:hypothetical protein
MDPASKTQIARSALGKLAVVVGLLCLACAVAFGLAQTVHVGSANAEVPNTTAAGASCGLGIAAGLCFVAAAIAEAGLGLPRPQGDGSAADAAPGEADRRPAGG